MSSPHRRRPRVGRWVVLALLGALWFVLARPSALGGSTGLVEVKGTSMLPTLHTHDLVVTRAHDTYRRYEIIVFTVPQGQPDAGLTVIHRVLGGDGVNGYITQGDNVAGPDPWHPSDRDVKGVVDLRIPRGAYVTAGLRTPLGVACSVVLIAALVYWAVAPRRRRSDATMPEPTTGRAASGSGLIPAELADTLAIALARRHRAESSPDARHALRTVAFDLAAELARRDPTFGSRAFLLRCGVFDDDSTTSAAPTAPRPATPNITIRATADPTLATHDDSAAHAAPVAVTTPPPPLARPTSYATAPPEPGTRSRRF